MRTTVKLLSQSILTALGEMSPQVAGESWAGMLLNSIYDFKKYDVIEDNAQGVETVLEDADLDKALAFCRVMNAGRGEHCDKIYYVESQEG